MSMDSALEVASATHRSRAKHGRSKATNHRDLLPKIKDGRATQARRFRDLVHAFISDAGGIDNVSEVKLALKAAFALPRGDEERKVFTAIGGERALPKQRVRELWCVVGRRGGKSRMAAALACYFALFVRHKLAGGERGMVLVLAMSLDQ